MKFFWLALASVTLLPMTASAQMWQPASYDPSSEPSIQQIATAVADPMLVESEKCEKLFPRYERLMSVPVYLLKAVALTESGRYHQPSKRLVAWPWAVHAEGKGYYPGSRQEAAALVRKFMSKGIQNIDVGCMQVNLMYHGAAFASVEDAFEPVQNVAYAAKFLQEHYMRVGTWKQAVSDYHSRTPGLGREYATKVLRNWNQAMTDAVTTGRLRYDQNVKGFVEDEAMASWDGMTRYPVPQTPMEWYYPSEEKGTDAHGVDRAKLQRVMQKQPSDVIFVRKETPAVPQAPAAAVQTPAQQVVYQRPQAPSAVPQAPVPQQQQPLIAMTPEQLQAIAPAAGQPQAMPPQQAVAHSPVAAPASQPGLTVATNAYQQPVQPLPPAAAPQPTMTFNDRWQQPPVVTVPAYVSQSVQPAPTQPSARQYNGVNMIFGN